MIKILPLYCCPVCPVCGAAVVQFAVVDSDTPGSPGSPFLWDHEDRALVHGLQGAWCHIRVGQDHKLVYLSKLAVPPGRLPDMR